VVADNCIDDTVDVARAAGADVIVRNDLKKIGKGYALDWGVQHLGADPPAIVIIFDADCRLARHAIAELAAACITTRRPAQALYLITESDQSSINYQVAEFAFLVKKRVRPLGLNALNLSCQMMGTGRAFPWETIRSTNLASRSIVEDLELGLKLAQAGHPLLFCLFAKVTSRFPWSSEGVRGQSKRWEGGTSA
jgi:cellulose synthase/poly-beta-1,6-N-acetylglucosamine synthase-like glycosyltransferase